MEPWKRSVGRGGELDFAESSVVIEDVDVAELVEVEAGMRGERGLQNLRADVDVFGQDEVADAGAIMALLHLVPPAVDLVADHGRLFDEERAAWEELEELGLGSGDGGEVFPAGEDGCSLRGFERFDSVLRWFAVFVVLFNT